MPLNIVCHFCGKPIEPGTGLMFVRNDNQRFYFCSRKCEQNQIKLKRRSRKIKWTAFYEKGPSPPQPEKKASEDDRKDVRAQSGKSKKEDKKAKKAKKTGEKKTEHAIEEEQVEDSGVEKVEEETKPEEE